MHDRPTASELLSIVAETLADVVVPATEPHARHQARVAANLCRIVARELDTPGAFELALADVEQTLGLLGTSGPNATDADRLALIAEAIRSIDDAQAAAIHGGIEALVRRKLDVAKPGYDAHDAAAEAGLIG